MLPRWDVHKRFLVNTDIQVSVLIAQLGESMVWLTSTSTGEPIQGARVYIYNNPKLDSVRPLHPAEYSISWYLHVLSAAKTGLCVLSKSGSVNVEDYILFAEGTTDADGKAAFRDLESYHLTLLIEHNKKFILLDGIGYGPSPYTASSRSTLIFDRKLVRPGEVLHVSGIWCPS